MMSLKGGDEEDDGEGMESSQDVSPLRLWKRTFVSGPSKAAHSWLTGLAEDGLRAPWSLDLHPSLPAPCIGRSNFKRWNDGRDVLVG